MFFSLFTTNGNRAEAGAVVCISCLPGFTGDGHWLNRVCVHTCVYFEQRDVKMLF